MPSRSRRVWLGIGAASLVGVSGTAAVQAQHAKHGTAPPTTAMDSNGLAAPLRGEAYLTDGGPRDTRIRIYRDIALMRGHLLVGAELIELGLWDEALPHFLHPTEELYAVMERYIKLHKVTPFDKQLLALGQAVKARSKPAYLQAARVVEERLTGALSSFKRFMQGRPFTSFTARTMVETLKVAQSEYEAAIEDGKFARPVEYQDSRGFVWYVGRLLDAHAAELGKIDSARLADMRAALAELKKAWPAPMPPEKLVVDAGALSAQVAAFEKAAERFYLGD